MGGTAAVSEGEILEEQKVSRKQKAKADLESHGKYGRFEDEPRDVIVDDSHEIHGKTSSSSITPE